MTILVDDDAEDAVARAKENAADAIDGAIIALVRMGEALADLRRMVAREAPIAAPARPNAPAAPRTKIAEAASALAPDKTAIRHGAVAVDIEGRTLWNGARSAALSPIAARVAAVVVRGMPGIMPRAEIVARVWAHPPATIEVALSAAIAEIRRAGEEIGLVLKSVKGVGVVMRIADEIT